MKRLITLLLAALMTLLFCAEWDNEFDNPWDDRGTNYNGGSRAITFDPNSGTVSPASGKTNRDKKLDSLPTPTRNGYDFNGWYTARTNGTKVDVNREYGDNSTIYARWTIKTYTIAFNTNGGSVSPTSGITGEGWKLDSLPTPTRNGYDFDGWYTARTNGTKVDVDKVYSENTTIYAQWTADDPITPPQQPTAYTITFDYNDGDIANTTAATGTNGKLASLPTPTRSGYDFSGWYTVATGGVEVNTSTAFSENTTIYAHWTPESVTPPQQPTAYTITLDYNGSDIANTTAATGTNGKLASLPTPTRDSYTFNGWWTAATGGVEVNTNTAFGGNTTIYAHWTPESVTPPVTNTYSLTISISEIGGGSVFRDPNKSAYEAGEQVAITATANNGYTFTGWSGALVDTANPVTITMDGHKSLTANFLRNDTPPVTNTYTLTISETNGGVVSRDPDKSTYDYGEPVTVTAIPAEGYKFTGWGGDIASASAVVRIPMDWNKTLTANFERITYTVTFDPNGGTVEPWSGTTWGESCKLASLPTPTRDGCIFVGWYTAATGGTKVDTSMVYLADTTIYARWVETFTDTRDNKPYKKVTIGTQTWMAENLNYYINDSTGVCYANSEDSCAKYGRLYDWAVAMDISQYYNSTLLNRGDVKHQGVCPVGWHLPSDAEWDTLMIAVGGSSTAGTKLKSPDYWNSPNNVPKGTDDYGFSALPACRGYSGGSFDNACNYGYWWSATENDAGLAYGPYMGHEFGSVFRSNNWKESLLSVRCVQD